MKAEEKYSLGMRQRLGIAQAIMEDPKLLVLDEPFNGLDKNGVAQIRQLLLELKEKRKTILLASHNEEDIRILCDEVYEMDGGVLRKRFDQRFPIPLREAGKDRGIGNSVNSCGDRRNEI